MSTTENPSPTDTTAGSIEKQPPAIIDSCITLVETVSTYNWGRCANVSLVLMFLGVVALFAAPLSPLHDRYGTATFYAVVSGLAGLCWTSLWCWLLFGAMESKTKARYVAMLAIVVVASAAGTGAIAAACYFTA